MEILIIFCHITGIIIAGFIIELRAAISAANADDETMLVNNTQLQFSHATCENLIN